MSWIRASNDQKPWEGARKLIYKLFPMFFLPVDQQWNIPRVPLTLLLFLLLLSDLACRECLYSLHGIIRIILRLLTYLIFQLTLSFPVVVLYTRHDLSSFIRVLEGVKNKQFDLGCFRCAVNTLKNQTKSNKIKTKKTSTRYVVLLVHLQ